MLRLPPAVAPWSSAHHRSSPSLLTEGRDSPAYRGARERAHAGGKIPGRIFKRVRLDEKEMTAGFHRSGFIRVVVLRLPRNEIQVINPVASPTTRTTWTAPATVGTSHEASRSPASPFDLSLSGRRAWRWRTIKPWSTPHHAQAFRSTSEIVIAGTEGTPFSWRSPAARRSPRTDARGAGLMASSSAAGAAEGAYEPGGQAAHGLRSSRHTDSGARPYQEGAISSVVAGASATTKQAPMPWSCHNTCMARMRRFVAMSVGMERREARRLIVEQGHLRDGRT